ncbi:amino acid permease/ SLC12A domain-containing protein [Blyttiomyces helicus]|uniref:Amino acid permease/ SLC12A domain-containing protein n=1 Tax=Blyttiomyces helicus TaxID=388810 RepID=A0A4P9WI73_9FUNG|nr:amino acid permease/ SLC12A domain-containing protein [Blyttiomyces helicus]|eukprot:RKO92464.1 amino acid permease/ SLC12A domain-containing protein [Blyttiomyces helicus]
MATKKSDTFEVVDHERGTGGAQVNQVGTKRKLQARHLQMIAIGGTIGTGLFLSSGGAIYNAGPAGALIAYVIAGILVYTVVCSLGEMSTYMPISGSFNTYASRFVHPSLGFTAAFAYWFQWSLTLPAELVAAAELINYWISKDSWLQSNNWVWWAILVVVLFTLNMIGVAVYGEMEYIMSFVKIAAVGFFMIMAICIDAGWVNSQPTVGFANWRTPLAPFKDGVPGIFSIFTNVVFAYGGCELVGITAGEAANPRKSVPRAINGTFWRIAFFYIGTIFLLGLVVSDTDKVLNNSDNTGGTSPFTEAFSNAHITWGADLINTIALISVFSAANSSMYAASRTLMAMSNEGGAPRIFGRTTRAGVPVYALFVSTAIGCLAFIGQVGAGTVFNWLQDIISTYILIAWLMILLTHIRFRMAYKAQGRNIADLPYKSYFFPYAQVIGLLVGLTALLGEGYVAIWYKKPFDVQNILEDYGKPTLDPLLLYRSDHLLTYPFLIHRRPRSVQSVW